MLGKTSLLASRPAEPGASTTLGSRSYPSRVPRRAPVRLRLCRAKRNRSATHDRALSRRVCYPSIRRMKTRPCLWQRGGIALAPLLWLVIPAHGANSATRPAAPRIWDDKALASWALPIVGVNAMPHFYTEAEYYAAPVVEFR